MATSLTLQNDPISPQGYLKVNGTTAATITTSGLSMSTLNSINVDDYTVLSDFTGTNQSLTSSGFQKLPGGLIIQWGSSGTLAANTSVTLTHPIAFPNNIFSISFANAYSTAGATVTTSVGVDLAESGIDPKTQFVIRNKGSVLQEGTRYIAVGY